MDITKWNDFSESGVLERYRDVCTRINLPRYVQNMSKWSINNYGNDFLAYYQPNCFENKWKAEHIPAGFECYGSACMFFYEKNDSVTNTVYKIQSIGPNPNSKYFWTSCVNQVVLWKDLLDIQQKQDLQFLSLSAKIDLLEKRINTLLMENEALKNKSVGL